MIIGALWSLAWPPAWALIWAAAVRRLTGRPPARLVIAVVWGGAPLLLAAAYFSSGLWPDGVASLANSVAAFLWWLWSRRRRKRAPKVAGAKARALLAAVVRTMRERTRVRPVLRPVPGGAR